MNLRLLAAATVIAALAAADAARAPSEPYMVSSANPHATEAGLAILAQGGSAVDAAIAVQAVLGLVEPQSSGIGGGAFILHWDARRQDLAAYDGRETAPDAVTSALFLDDQGAPREHFDAVVSGSAIGVPGVIAVLWLAHQEHGRLAWADLFAPAIALAEDGFAVSPRLHGMLSWSAALPRLPWTRALFFTGGAGGAEPEPLPVGALLRNPAYARSLELIAAHGRDGFYRGPLARAIVRASQEAPRLPGMLTLSDLERYRAVKRAPLCRPYRAWVVCGMPPPTSGGLAVLQILGLLENFDMAALEPSGAGAVHVITEASRLAYADRDAYAADPDFIDVPVAGLLNPAYLARRAARIDRSRSMGPAPAAAGRPDHAQGGLHPNVPAARASTTHFAILDAFGNAVSMTSSVEAPFGSHMMAGGFFLNNQLTDFSFVPEVDGVPVANAVAPGKRPRSSMSPTMVFDADGHLYAMVGSPGGSRIIAYVAQTLVALLDWGMDMQAALDLPHHVNRNGPLDLEAGTPLEALAPALSALGHEVNVRSLTSGLHGIRLAPGGPDGGADKRREGVARAGPAAR